MDMILKLINDINNKNLNIKEKAEIVVSNSRIIKNNVCQEIILYIFS